MILSRTTLAREANEKAAELRDELEIASNAPLCVFDVCARLDLPVRVQFVDISMEGLYVRSKRPLIQVSALRPLPRRVTNCAHELGHHAFGHGSTIDELQEEHAENPVFNPNEFLANAFAGFFLMPLLAVRRAFTLRGWRPETATAEQCFVVACSLGVGQETLIQHMAYGLRIISAAQAQTLLRTRLPAIRRGLLGNHAAERLLVVDRHHAMPTADTEVGTHVLLPAGTEAEFDGLSLLTDLPAGRLFLAQRPGLVRAFDPSGAWAVVIRISRYQYVGWSQNRHLELEEGDDE
jgi:Zn-dependent peptidase ImmA (M78 family)